MSEIMFSATEYGIRGGRTDVADLCHTFSKSLTSVSCFLEAVMVRGCLIACPGLD